MICGHFQNPVTFNTYYHVVSDVQHSALHKRKQDDTTSEWYYIYIHAS